MFNEHYSLISSFVLTFFRSKYPLRLTPACFLSLHLALLVWIYRYIVQFLDPLFQILIITVKI